MREIQFDMSKVDGVGSDRNRRDMDILTGLCARADTPKEAVGIISGSIGEVVGKYISEQLWAAWQDEGWVNPYEDAAWNIAEENLKKQGCRIERVGVNDYRVVVSDAGPTAKAECRETQDGPAAERPEPPVEERPSDTVFSDAQIAQIRKIVDEAVHVAVLRERASIPVFTFA